MKRQFIGKHSDHLKVGILGFPNVGKSMLLNALLGKNLAGVENCLFSTIDVNVGVAKVDDKVIDWLSKQYELNDCHFSQISFFDCCGIVENSSKGEGLEIQYDLLKNMDVLVQLLRGFGDKDVTHYHETVDPARDMDIVTYELMVQDVLRIEDLITRIEPSLRRKEGGRELSFEHEVLIKCWYFLCGVPRKDTLAQEKPQKYGLKKDKPAPPKSLIPGRLEGYPLRLKKWMSRELDVLEKFNFLTTKEALYIVNVDPLEYLRSLPNPAMPTGRESPHVIAVKQRLHEFELMGYQRGHPTAQSLAKAVLDFAKDVVDPTKIETKPRDDDDVAADVNGSGGCEAGGGKADAPATDTRTEDIKKGWEADDGEEEDDEEYGLKRDARGNDDDDELGGTVVDAHAAASGLFDDADDVVALGGDADAGKRGPPSSHSNFHLSRVRAISLPFEERWAQVFASGEGEEYLLANPSHQSGVANLISEVLSTAGLIRFYTMDLAKKRVKAWYLRRGLSTVDAAAVVDTEVARNFMRGDVITFDELVEYGGDLTLLRLHGKIRGRGGKHAVNEGDIIEFFKMVPQTNPVR